MAAQAVAAVAATAAGVPAAAAVAAAEVAEATDHQKNLRPEDKQENDGGNKTPCNR